MNVTVTNARLSKRKEGEEESERTEGARGQKPERRQRSLIKDKVGMAEWREEGDEGWVVAAVLI